MSTPANPLAKYRSYKYYHVLVMCDSSVTADFLSDAIEAEKWLHPTSLQEASKFDLMGKYAPKQLPPEAGGGQYVVIINGAVDADFMIESVKWLSTLTGVAVPGDRSNSQANEGSIQIIEPRGVAFFDTVVLSAITLGVDPSTAAFLLKTFIVGHGIDQQRGEFTDTISDIQPVHFTLTDATATFTEAGGVYNLNFVGQANGASRMPQYSKIGAGLKLALSNTGTNSGGVTLQSALTSLENKVQTLYDQNYQCLSAALDRAAADAQLSTKPSENFAKIHYHITLDQMYDQTYIVTDSPSAYKDLGLCDEGLHIDEGSNASIETAIINILNKCPKIRADAALGASQDNSKFPEKTKLQYKIKTAVRTSPDEQYGLRYDVFYHVAPFVSAVDLPISKILQSTDSTPLKTALEQNVIEFDYTYTGKNIDITKFDMQMNYGYAYLQTATMSNSFADQLEMTMSRSSHIPPISGSVSRFGQMARIPMPFSTQINSKDLVNTNFPSSTTQAAYTITRAASIEVANCTVSIVGNYNLLTTLGRATRTTPEYITSSQDGQMEIRESTGEQTADLTSWGHYPAYAKINIRMPTNANNYYNEDLVSNREFSQPFWYDGYFHINTIENIFEGGIFTQVLSMVHVPNDNIDPEVSKQQEALTESLARHSTNCYDSVIPVDTSQQSKVAVQPIKRPEMDSPNIAVDPATTSPISMDQPKEEEQISDTNDPTQVRGWNKASEPVKQAIRQASKRYGVDIVTLAMFAYKESSFNPNAKAPKGSASGLYQHIDSTWYGLVKQGKIYGIPSNTPEAQAGPLRFNPQFSAYGGAAYINEVIRSVGSTHPGDIYLGYFAGPVTAKKIINACLNSSGATLAQAVGSKLATKMQTNNPSIIRANMTCCSLRSWAHNAMAKSLGKGASLPESTGGSNPPRASGSTTGASNTEPPTAARSQASSEFEPTTQPKTSRTAADALGAVTDPAIIQQQLDKTICGANKLPDVNTNEGQGQ